MRTEKEWLALLRRDAEEINCNTITLLDIKAIQSDARADIQTQLAAVTVERDAANARAEDAMRVAAMNELYARAWQVKTGELPGKALAELLRDPLRLVDFIINECDHEQDKRIGKAAWKIHDLLSAVLGDKP